MIQSGVTDVKTTDSTGGFYVVSITCKDPASDSAGTSGYSQEATSVIPPAPANFTANLVRGKASTYNFNWSASPGATVYTIQYGTAKGTYTDTLVTLYGTQITQPVTLSKGTYYFVVKAGSDNAISNPSNYQTITIH